MLQAALLPLVEASPWRYWPDDPPDMRAAAVAGTLTTSATRAGAEPWPAALDASNGRDVPLALVMDASTADVPFSPCVAGRPTKKRPSWNTFWRRKMKGGGVAHVGPGRASGSAGDALDVGEFGGAHRRRFGHRLLDVRRQVLQPILALLVAPLRNKTQFHESRTSR